jgi:two-component system nitrate/nitrite response regulator NarL
MTMALPDKQAYDRILVASNDPGISRHFHKVLKDSYDTLFTATAEDLLITLDRHSPALLVLDPGLFPDNSTDMICAVIRKAPETHVLVVENKDTRKVDQHALFKAGARGFCMENITPALLTKAVQLILKGDYWVQRRLITEAISELARESAANARQHFDNELINTLTARELQVARMVHMGGNNKMIARELDISERTVKAHLSSIFRKLEIENRLNLALFFSEIS